jgi:hypothetical protein
LYTLVSGPEIRLHNNNRTTAATALQQHALSTLSTAGYVTLLAHPCDILVAQTAEAQHNKLLDFHALQYFKVNEVKKILAKRLDFARYICENTVFTFMDP